MGWKDIGKKKVEEMEMWVSDGSNGAKYWD
jgi:hypothetical protein